MHQNIWHKMLCLNHYKVVFDPRKNVYACVNLTDICLLNIVEAFQSVLNFKMEAKRSDLIAWLSFLLNGERNRKRNSYSPLLKEKEGCRELNYICLIKNLFSGNEIQLTITRKIFFAGAYDQYFLITFLRRMKHFCASTLNIDFITFLKRLRY